MFAKSALRSIARSVPAASRPLTASVLPSAFLRSSSRISSASPSSLLSRSYVSPAPTDSEEAIAADKGELEGEPTVEGAGKQEQAAPVDAKKFKEMEDKLEAQSKKVAELTSALQYSQADFANLQRRSTEEQTKAKSFAIQKFASDLLGTIDILTLALKHTTQPVPAEQEELVNLFNGVEMTKKELLKTLGRHGVKQFDPTGEKFDPNLHEALYQAPIPGKEPGTVFETSTLGYTLNDRTLRAAQVGVVREA